MSDYAITAIAAEGPVAVLSVAIGELVHLVRVTPAGAVLVPAELAQHYEREAIEAECLRMAVQARLGWMA